MGVVSFSILHGGVPVILGYLPEKEAAPSARPCINSLHLIMSSGFGVIRSPYSIKRL